MKIKNFINTQYNCYWLYSYILDVRFWEFEITGPFPATDIWRRAGIGAGVGGGISNNEFLRIKIDEDATGCTRGTVPPPPTTEPICLGGSGGGERSRGGNIGASGACRTCVK